MDVRLTTEQRELRDAAARLAVELGPGSVLDLDDADRLTRLEKAVSATGWRGLRSDGASGVEVALVAEEFARGLVDVPFLGPILADDLLADGEIRTIGVDGEALDAKGIERVLVVDDGRIQGGRAGTVMAGADLTRWNAEVIGPFETLGTLPADRSEKWRALALVVTTADVLGAARGAHALAVDYAKVRKQYGATIGSYQAIAHLLAEGLALVEGSISVLRHAAWAVDELPSDEAVHAAQIAKLYCVRAARTICESSVQVHGGIGNTWECLVHVYLRRVLASAELFPVALEEIDLGLS